MLRYCTMFDEMSRKYVVIKTKSVCHATFSLCSFAPKDGGDGKGNPLCAIVSGHFVEVAGRTLLALSSDRTAAEASQSIRKLQHAFTRGVVSNQSTVKSRRTKAFSFLELPVDAPVDLIIGSRYFNLRRLMRAIKPHYLNPRVRHEMLSLVPSCHFEFSGLMPSNHRNPITDN